MPHDKNGGPPLSYLEHLSTEQLEELLSQDFVSSRTSDPDPDYIIAIMEVMKKREAESPTGPEIDVDAAWREFQEDYQGQSAAFESMYLCDQPTHHPDQISSPPKRVRFPKALRGLVAAAAIIVVLCGAASAFGFNVFQTVASWTAEVFGFSEQNTNQEDPFEKIRSAVAMESSLSVVPNWAPENTYSATSVTSTEFSFGTKIQETFATENGLFYIRVFLYSEPQEKSEATYQKDENNVTEYLTGGVTHYIMNNNEKSSVTWNIETVEVCIQGDLTVEDLIQMIDSIYEE